MVYTRLYDRFYYPTRSGTPGAPGTGEHEARGRIASPSAAHVYSALPPSEVHHQTMVQQFPSQIPPQLQLLLQVNKKKNSIFLFISIFFPPNVSEYNVGFILYLSLVACARLISCKLLNNLGTFWLIFLCIFLQSLPN